MQSETAREGWDAVSLSTLVQMVGAVSVVHADPRNGGPVETRSAQVAVNAFPRPEPTRRVGISGAKTSPLAATNCPKSPI